jgi:hypothetical protein
MDVARMVIMLDALMPARLSMFVFVFFVGGTAHEYFLS